MLINTFLRYYFIFAEYNLFNANVPIFYPLKTAEKLSWAFEIICQWDAFNNHLQELSIKETCILFSKN